MLRQGARPSALAGFTLVELIVVLILLAILAFVALPRLGDRVFEARGTHDAVKAAVQHARRVAVASRRYVCVAAGAGGVALTMDPRVPETAGAVTCTESIDLPTRTHGCAANAVCAPAGITLAGAGAIVFDPLGRSATLARAVETAALSLTLPDQPAITIAAETGWVQ